MHAHVFKSLRKTDAYVYLAAREGIERVPAPMRAQLEPLQFVLDVDLTPPRTLARADADDVRESLVTRGYYLQMPQLHALDPMTEDHGTDA